MDKLEILYLSWFVGSR